MKPHEERVVVEKDELVDKIARLEQFIQHSLIYKALPEDERDRMSKQLVAMREYATILGERIKNFPK